MITKDKIKLLNNIHLSVLKVIHFRSDLNWKLSRRLIKRDTLCCILKGNGKVTIDGTTHIVEPGRLYFLKSGTMIDAKANDGKRVELYFMPFSYSFVSQKNNQPTSEFPLQGEYRVQHSPQIINLLDKLYNSKDSEIELTKMRQSFIFRELIYRLVKNLSIDNSNGSTAEVIEKVMDYIRENFMKELKIDSLAVMAGLSTSNFSRVFKKVTGMRPTDYLTKLRINRAKQLLVMSDYRLREIAHSIGYKDELYLSRVFKKVVGETPTSYMKKHRQKIVTFNHNFTDYLLALGVQPVATTVYDKPDNVNGYLPHIADVMKGTKIVGAIYTPNKSAVLKSEPDIIITDHDHGNYNQLAPTRSFYWQDDWRSIFKSIAVMVGKENEAKNWLNAYNKKVENAKKQLTDITRNKETVMILRVMSHEMRIYGGKRQLGSVLYRDLGLHPPNGISKADHFFVKNVDDLKALNPDHIVLFESEGPLTRKKIDDLKKSNVWRNLSAVKAGNVYEIANCFNSHAPLISSNAIDKVLEVLEKEEEKTNMKISP